MNRLLLIFCIGSATTAKQTTEYPTTANLTTANRTTNGTWANATKVEESTIILIPKNQTTSLSYNFTDNDMNQTGIMLIDHFYDIPMSLQHGNLNGFPLHYGGAEFVDMNSHYNFVIETAYLTSSGINRSNSFDVAGFYVIPATNLATNVTSPRLKYFISYSYNKLYWRSEPKRKNKTDPIITTNLVSTKLVYIFASIDRRGNSITFRWAPNGVFKAPLGNDEMDDVVVVRLRRDALFYVDQVDLGFSGFFRNIKAKTFLNMDENPYVKPNYFSAMYTVLIYLLIVLTFFVYGAINAYYQGVVTFRIMGTLRKAWNDEPWQGE